MDKKALLAPHGIRHVKYRYDIMDGNIKKGDLSVISGSISHKSTNSIKTTMSIKCKDSTLIDWHKDYIKIYMLIKSDSSNQWEEYPLGVFVPLSPICVYGNGSSSLTVTGYDLSVILKEEKLVERFYIPADTLYMEAIQNILISSGLDKISMDDCDSVLTTEREFEIGTPKLEIVNILLSEINYRSLAISAEGISLLKKIKKATASTINHQYENDQFSVLCENIETSLDIYNIPNVFIAEVSSPEQPPMRAIYINDDPYSATSTIGRGRKIVSEIFCLDSVPNQETLDEYVRIQSMEASNIFKEIIFKTLNMPNHGDRNCIYLNHPTINGVFEEMAWDMDLMAGGIMSHTVRKAVQL